MNKKLAFLICILALIAVKIRAQDYTYGIYLGINGCTMILGNTLYYDDSEVITTTRLQWNEAHQDYDTIYNVNYATIDNASVSGMPPLTFTIGGFYEKPIRDNIGVQLHLIYANYGYSVKGTVIVPNIADEFSAEYDYTGEMKMTNLSASLLLKFNATPEISIQAGITPSLCIRAQKNVKRGPMHKTLNYKSGDEYKPFNICGTVGITYYFIDCIMFSLHANIGLVDVLKVKNPYLEDERDRYGTVKYRYSSAKSTTTSVGLTVGYRF